MVDSPNLSHDHSKLSRRSTFLRKSTVAIAGSALAFGSSIALLAPVSSSASSHREAPLIANDPQADNTDVYAFRSPDKPSTVTLISNWHPFEEPGGGPNFYPWSTDALYQVHLDTNGDSWPDITFRWQFHTQDTRGTNTFLYNNGPVNRLTDKTLLFKQTYTLTEFRPGKTPIVLIKNGQVAPSDVGNASMPNYRSLRDQAITRLPDGTQNYVGQADDPFFLDLRVFDLLYGGNLGETGADTLNGFNVNTIALQIPIKDLGFKKGQSIVGVWSSTLRRSLRVQRADGSQGYYGKYVQVSRLGNPLVNEVVVPAGLKDTFNAIPPAVDHLVPAVVNKVLDPEVPKLIQSIYKIPAPPTPRKDLFAIFLTGLKGLNQPPSVVPAEMLRLNTAIPPFKTGVATSRLGVLAGDNAGFPNGRRLGDDVVDIALQAMEGAVKVDKNGAPTGVSIVKPLAAGDRVNANDKAFYGSFPYIALPWSGSRVRPGSSTGASTVAMPTGSTTRTNAGPDGLLNTVGQFVNNASPVVVPAGTAALGTLLAMAGIVLFRRERRQGLAAR